MTAPKPSGRVAELERAIAATVSQNGELRRKHAEQLARNDALLTDLHAHLLTIQRLRGENDRLAADLATARIKVGVL